MDPWHWTIDEVVRNLCQSRELWDDRPNSSLPDAQDFEQTLRENEVNGATLLEGLDIKSLKEELGVKALGKRTAIIYAIEKLRSLSPRYISHRATISSYQHQIDDQAGTLSPAPTPPPPRTLPLQQDLFPSIQSAPSRTSRAGEILIQPIDGGKKRRKLQLGPENNVPKVPETKESLNAYLGKAKTLLDDIFFDRIVDEDLSGDDLTDDISILQSKPLFPGRRRFVHKRLCYFLQSDVTRLDDSRLVLHPYPEKLVKPGDGKSVMLFQSVDNKVKVTKRDAVLLEQGLEAPAGNGSENHDWDFLIKYTNNNVNEDALPILGESGSENDYEGSLLEEYEKEEEEERILNNRKQSQYLSKDIIATAIDNAITDLEQRWIEGKLPVRQAKAWSVWRQAHGRYRQNRIDESRHEIERLDARLMKLRSSICDEVWKTTAAIHTQCACMELSVSQRQDALWRLKLWAEKQPPPYQNTNGKSRTRKLHVHEIEEDDEVLDTDSEDADDFIDIDHVMDVDFWTKSPRSTSPRSPLDIAKESAHLPSSPPDFPALLPPSIDSSHRFIEVEDRSSSMSIDSDSGESGDDDKPGRLVNKEAEGSPENPTSMTTLDNEDVEDDKQLNKRRFEPQILYLDDDSNSSVAKIQDVVDLTQIPTSPPEVEDAEVSKHIEVPRFSNTPEADSEQQIEDWTWEELEELGDRKRLVLKLLHTMPPKLSKGIKRHFWKVKQSTLKDEVTRGIGTIQRRESYMLGIDNEIFPKVIGSAKLWVCWEMCNHRYLKENISQKIAKEIIKGSSRENFNPFYNFIQLVAKFSADESDSEGEPGDKISPRKGRTHGVRKSRVAQELRQVAQQRRIEGEARQQQLKLHLESRGLSTDANGIIINDTKKDDEDLIYVNPHIGSRIKSHQIDGVRFMWRELVTVGQSAMQGCLLAHTMGLGKTMQTITILVTIAEAGASDKPDTVKQIPKALRLSRTLILCPPGLIENWKDEFRTWQPRDTVNVGKIYEIASIEMPTAKRRLEMRLDTISNWCDTGGVLILGYQMFRNITNNTAVRGKDPPMTEEQHQQVTEQLLSGPNIIVADEAHTLKNTKSGIGVAAKRFKSTSRIALTGSPLANNLQDYYAMIDWVAPEYLGEALEFKAYYQEPIENGTYMDSTPTEIRKSLKKLAALKREIDPKVSRADITVLRGDLKPKLEFVIKIPLTPLQREAYTLFVRSVLENETQVANARIWDWIAVLGLLINHPSSFLAKLQEREAARREGKLRALDQLPKFPVDKPEDLLGMPADVDLTKLDLSDKMVQAQREIFESAEISDPRDPQLSNKTAIIAKILSHCKEIGDQVLVFSHHIPTLNYLERFVRTIRPQVNAVRLDGQTNMTDRLVKAKDFNLGKYDVFLISTRAGGLGLNIPGANRVILVDFNFNPTHEEQAVGRAYRIGQKKPVFVYHLITGGTFEETVHYMTIFKRQLAARVVDKKNPTRSAHKTRDFLFEPREVMQEDLEEFKGKDEVLDAILDDNIIRSLKTTETLHAETNEDLTEEEMKEVDEMVKDDHLRKTNNAAWKEKISRQMIQEQMNSIGYIGTTPGSIIVPIQCATPIQPSQPARALTMVVQTLPAQPAGALPDLEGEKDMPIAVEAQTLPPGTQNFAPGTQNLPPTTQNIPPTTQNLPPTTQNIPPTTQNLSPTTQKFIHPFHRDETDAFQF